MIAPLVRAVLRWDLGRAFDRVVWAGPAPRLPDAPVVAYANHQQWYDGHLLWRAAASLSRPFLVWMEARDRYPALGTAGALPFPPNDGLRRARTIRQTARQMHSRPAPLLGYFPEGRLHADTEPLERWDPLDLTRLARLLPGAVWLPVGIAAVSAGTRRPIAVLCPGPVQPRPDGQERDRLDQLVLAARTTPPGAWTDL